MVITKRVEIGEIRVRPDGSMNVRTDTIIEEDGVEISRSYHRKVIQADEDIAAEDSFVQEIGAPLRTPERINKVIEDRRKEK